MCVGFLHIWYVVYSLISMVKKELWRFVEVIQFHCDFPFSFSLWNYFFFLFFALLSGLTDAIRDQAEVSLVSIQPSLSSSLSESSDSESSMATRLARIEATSSIAVFLSISFCSDFSTLRKLMPRNGKGKLEMKEI